MLNRLFRTGGILVREAFTRVASTGEGVVEQIDGVIELDGEIYLVEMKWWDKPLGTGEVSHHLVRVFSRHCARGLLISYSGYTDPSVMTCKEALARMVVVLCGLQEVVQLLEREDDLAEFLRKKVRAAVIDKNPHFRVYASLVGNGNENHTNDESPTWLKIMQNGTIGEARSRAFLLDRFWVLERSVDIDGADFIIQRRLLLQNLLDREAPRLGVVQVKFYGTQQTSHYVHKEYVVDKVGAPRTEFFLLCHSGAEEDQRVFLLTAKEIVDSFALNEGGNQVLPSME